MKISTERAEKTAEIIGGVCAEIIRALEKERDELKEQLSDWRGVCTRRSEELSDVYQQLAAAQAVIAKKDEALDMAEVALSECRDYPITLDAVIEALHLPSDDTALREMIAEQWEKAAKVCEKSDRYRGDYFAALIRAEAEKLRRK